jgi:hypothetical protein
MITTRGLLVHLFVLLSSFSAYSQSIEFVIDGKVDILVIDPTGRKTGFDEKTVSNFSQIPNLSIGSASIGIVDSATGESTIDSSTMDMVDGIISPAINGEYQFILQGKENSLTYVNPMINFSQSTQSKNISDGSIIDSNMTVKFSLFFADNNGEQTYLRKYIDNDYLVKSLYAMRNRNWIYDDATMFKYISNVNAFYSLVAINNITGAHLELDSIKSEIKSDSIRQAISSQGLSYFSDDIVQIDSEFSQPASPPHVDVKLVNSTGTKLTGGSLQYYDGSWKPAVNNNDGTFTINTTLKTVSLQMTYAYGVQTKSNVTVGSDTVVFQTVNAQVKLQNSQGGLMDTGTVQYYAGAWRNFGTTSNGVATMELLPVNYSFSMTYAFASNNKAQDLSANPIVVFQTTNTSVQLKNSQGNLMDTGTVQYYSGAWRAFGTTTNGYRDERASAE